ncbi:hypothetical protein [Rhodopirellula bahusiensis]|uniref:hypothetical protein n=2 Tax=Rhodopirellula bahusiensis TaxID=2014065 RepID=UPI0032661021
MGFLTDVLKSTASMLQAVHGDSNAIVLTRVGGSATPTDGMVYREHSTWRRKASGDREQVWTRKVVLPPDVADVPVGSVFTVDSTVYTVESSSRSKANQSQTIIGNRNSPTSVSRPNYYGRR